MTISKIPPGIGIRWMYNEQTDSSEMPSRAQGLSGLLRLTSAVAAAGATLPPEFTALKNRLVAAVRGRARRR